MFCIFQREPTTPLVWQFVELRSFVELLRDEPDTARQLDNGADGVWFHSGEGTYKACRIDGPRALQLLELLPPPQRNALMLERRRRLAFEVDLLDGDLPLGGNNLAERLHQLALWCVQHNVHSGVAEVLGSAVPVVGVRPEVWARLLTHTLARPTPGVPPDDDGVQRVELRLEGVLVRAALQHPVPDDGGAS